VCGQGAVVAGVYTRDTLLARHLQSAVLECSREQNTPVIIVQSVSPLGTQQTALSAGISASLFSTSSALQVPATAHVNNRNSPPPPVKAGILSPNVSTSALSSSVALGVSAADGPVCEKNPVEALTQTDRDWKEFEEVLSEEFLSFAPPVSAAAMAVTASSCHQTKDAISSSYVTLPLRAPGFITPSNATFLFAFNLFLCFCTSADCASA